MSAPDTTRPDAPVRLCCFQRHYGPVCPDGKVMCCLCFERFDEAALSETVDGDKQDVCVRCSELEADRASRPQDERAPKPETESRGGVGGTDG